MNEQSAVGDLVPTGFSASGPPPATAKNLGDPTESDTAGGTNTATDVGCGASPTTGSSSPEPSPNCFVGNPINAATGNKFQVERDFTGAPVTQLALIRYYNSQDTTAGAFGTGWRSTWQRSVNALSPTAVTVTRADGRADVFTLNGNTWQADPDVTSRLTTMLNSSNQQIGWRVITNDDTVETYALTGQLTAVTTRAGLTTTLSYNASAQLTAVTGPFGDKLSFAHDASGRIISMTAPDGGIYSYAYDGNNNLISATHPDGSIRKYVYGNASFIHALTAIIDENGNTFASWTYDAEGRAVSSQHAGGADLTKVAYGAGTSTATDARGNAHTYTLLTQFNLVKPTALSGAVYPPAGGHAFTYDVDGFLASRTDYDGNLTTYTHDARGDQTSRTEASGHRAGTHDLHRMAGDLPSTDIDHRTGPRHEFQL